MKFDYNKLRGKIRELFGSENDFASALGVSAHSLSKKLNSKAPFRQLEITKACELLGIPVSEIGLYFFTIKVQNCLNKRDER